MFHHTNMDRLALVHLISGWFAKYLEFHSQIEPLGEWIFGRYLKKKWFRVIIFNV